MKIFTSYFYQVRNFEPYMIPLSTAMWDPKWYSNRGSVYLDKNGVYNGLRIDPLVPDESCNGLCRGIENCLVKNSSSCQFLKKYREQLDKVDINQLLSDLSHLDEINPTTHETYIVLLFHEAPNNPCSERGVVQEWFKDNGYTIKELFS